MKNKNDLRPAESKAMTEGRIRGRLSTEPYEAVERCEFGHDIDEKTMTKAEGLFYKGEQLFWAYCKRCKTSVQIFQRGRAR